MIAKPAGPGLVARLGLLLLTALWTVGSVPAAPAVGEGRVVGRITDLATGGPVAGARVRAGGAFAISDENGRFLLALPPGSYRVRAEAAGFMGATAVDRLVTDGALNVDIGLPPLVAGPAEARAVAERLREGALRAAAAEPDGAAPVAVPRRRTEVPRTVRVLMPTGEIVELETDEYLKGVVPSEMGWIFRRSFEALAAQAIASRTYASTSCLADSAGDPARCEPGLDANVDTTTRTQVWQPVHYDLTDQAVSATHGRAVRDGDGLVQALYFARTADRTLASEDSPCCGGRAVAYLRAVDSPDPFRERRGHGAGMSQEGAATMAAWGATAEEIVAYYYTGTRVDPPGQPWLYDGGVSPRQGTAADTFVFEVSYADPDGDPPAEGVLVLDGEARALAGPTGAGHDYRMGASYALTTTLAAGEHAFRFRFADGFTDPVELDGGTLTVAPAPDATATAPSPAARDGSSGIRAAAIDVSAGAFSVTGQPEPGAARDDADADADAGPAAVVMDGPVARSEFPFMALAARWTGTLPDGAAAEIALRTSRDGATWSDWTPLAEEESDQREAAAAGEHWTRLLVARGRYVQARVTLRPGSGGRPILDGLTIHVLNTDAGPSAPAIRALGAGPSVLARGDWGADEGLRFDEDGDEIWPPRYTAPRAQIVHHTVTTNDPADPAAVVRAIYYFHAVTREWGDIGYNFLIDHRGVIYEGRFGGERGDLYVQGGHALQYNANSIGVALLGTFTDVAANPSVVAEAALVEQLASRGVRHDIEPDDPVTLAGTRFAHSVMGHRDALPGHTVCPGDGLHGRLPAVRSATALRMAELRAARPTDTPDTPGPTATDAPTATPVATVTPPGPDCVDRVTGGGFEDVDDAWQLHRAYYTGWDVHSGRQAMFVGLRNNDPDEERTYASAAQVVRLPRPLGTVRLTFAARATGDDGDLRLVRVLDSTGSVIALPEMALPVTGGWATYELDLTADLAGHAGEEVRLYFAVINNGDGRRSYARLDDVALVTCPDQAPYPGPTASSGPTAPPPVIPSPTPGVECLDVLGGGDFEAEGLAGWRLVGNHPAERVSSPAHDGEGALLLGLTDPAADAFGFAAAAREVVLPAGTVSATLSLWLRPVRLAPDDAVVVELRRTTDGLRRVLYGPAPESPPGAWTGHEIVLRAGDEPELEGPLELYVAVLNRGQGDVRGAVSAIAVDDVALRACVPSGAAGTSHLPATWRRH